MRLPSTGLTVTLGTLVVLGALAAAEAWAQPASVGPMGTPMTGVDEKIQEVADAKARFTKLDFAGALTLLREAVKKNADRLPPAQVILAMWYAEANQGAAVLGSLEMAVAEDPGDPQAYLILGNVELQAGRVTAAGLLFDKAQSVMGSFKSPNRKKSLEPNVYAGLAAVAESRATIADEDKARANQEWVGAEERLRTWLKLDPNNAIALQRLARALFKQRTSEKVNEASERLKEAKKADPNVLTPAATMAKFYQEEGDFKNAKKWMEYALSPQLGSEDLRTLLEAARWCVQTALEDPGQLEEAKKHASKAIRLDEKSMDALILRGVVALFQKEYEPAERYFLSAHVLSPANFAASNNLALALCEQNEAKKRQAMEYARNNAQQYQNSPEAASTYGWVLYKNNQLAEADNVLSRLVRSVRVNEDTLYYAARVASERRRPEEANQLLQRALGTKNPFSMRPEAQLLLEQLRKAPSTP